MPPIAASKAWKDCYAATAMLEYPDLLRRSRCVGRGTVRRIGIDNLIEIEKRTVEKEWAPCWITDAFHLTPDKSILEDLRR